MKMVAVIPAYNAEAFLPQVIDRLSFYAPEVDKLVVNDGSSDGTLEAAQRSGAKVISHRTNLGKGRALKTGFNFALKNDYDLVVTMDADGQHDPKSLPAMLLHQKVTKADIVIGSRMSNIEDMPIGRRFSNTITSLVISLCTEQTILDSQCGYRVIKRAVLESVTLLDSGYMLESELLIKAGKLGFKIVFCPIETIYGSEKSFIKPWRDTVKFVSLITKSLFWT